MVRARVEMGDEVTLSDHTVQAWSPDSSLKFVVRTDGVPSGDHFTSDKLLRTP